MRVISQAAEEMTRLWSLVVDVFTLDDQARIIPLFVKLVMTADTAEESKALEEVKKAQAVVDSKNDSVKDGRFLKAVTLLLLVKAYHIERCESERLASEYIPPEINKANGWKEIGRILDFLEKLPEEHSTYLIQRASNETYWDHFFTKKHLEWLLPLQDSLWKRVKK